MSRIKKKSERNMLLLAALSLLSGVVAAMLGYAYIEKRIGDERTQDVVKQKPRDETPELRSVVMVNSDISRGELIKATELTVAEIPTGVFNVPGALSHPEQAVGRIALQNLYAGEWLIDRKVTDGNGSGDRWNRLLGVGMRAIRVPVDQVTGMIGLIEPNDRVDLIAVLPGRDGKTVVSRILEQNVSVLAVGQQRLPRNDDDTVDSAGLKITSVTIEVSQEQAERVALALELGKVRLALRNSSDTKINSSDGTRLLELMRSTKSVVRKHVARGHHIQVISGDAISVKEVGQ